MANEGSTLQSVHDAYSRVARDGTDRAYAERVATAFGYSAEELLSVPEDSHMGLSCGNPLATAHLKQGEHVVDLGSGGGFDVFLAATKVGSTGQVVGLDMSDDMLARARRNAIKAKVAPPHVGFAHAVFGAPEGLPINADSVDCILSNCVLNLVPNESKAPLAKELFRILRPGGRLAIHDILAKRPMDDTLKANMALYIGCISGAITQDEFENQLRDAGFEDIIIKDDQSDLNVFFETDGVGSTSISPAAPTSSCCGGASAPQPDFDVSKFNANEHAASCSVLAIKPVKPVTMQSTSRPSILTHWQDAFPSPVAKVASASPREVASWIRSDPPTTLIVDVRDDNELQKTGTVRGSLHLPSRRFHVDLHYPDATIPSQLRPENAPAKVAFYCGSSRGRGPRCAGWYADWLQEHNVRTTEAVILEGGWTAWKEAFGDDPSYVQQV